MPQDAVVCGGVFPFYGFTGFAMEYAAEESALSLRLGCVACLRRCGCAFFGALLAGVFHIFHYHALVGAYDVQERFACGVNAVAVAYAHGPVHTSVILAVPVGDAACAQSAVRYYQAFVVVGVDDGVENLYLAYCACVALCFYIIAYAVGLEQQNQHSAGEVLQRAAQCHANSYACRCENGDERGCLYAENADDCHHQNEVQQHAHKAEQERAQRAVYAPAHEYAHEHAVQLVDDKAAHVEHEYGDSQVDGQLHESGDHGVYKLVYRQRFEHAYFRLYVGHGIRHGGGYGLQE